MFARLVFYKKIIIKQINCIIRKIVLLLKNSIAYITTVIYLLIMYLLDNLFNLNDELCTFIYSV